MSAGRCSEREKTTAPTSQVPGLTRRDKPSSSGRSPFTAITDGNKGRLPYLSKTRRTPTLSLPAVVSMEGVPCTDRPVRRAAVSYLRKVRAARDWFTPGA